MLFFNICPSMAQGNSDADPHLKVNDTIQIAVYNEPDLSTSARILKSGEVMLPLIGPVKIAGLTVSKANQTIRDLYAKDYLVDPKLTLTVDDYSQDMISILGSVRAPGQFALPASGKLDLASAIAQAGGLTADADPLGVVLTRASGGASTYSATGLQRGAPVLLRSGDRIHVRQSAFAGLSVQVTGKVGRPGTVAFPADGKLTLLDAILLSGDCTELGNRSKIKVTRAGLLTIVDLKDMIEKGKPPYYLKPGDIVNVPDRFW